jgi:hypothetical protein
MDWAVEFPAKIGLADLLFFHYSPLNIARGIRKGHILLIRESHSEQYA